MYKRVSGRSASTSDPGDREKGSAIRNVSTPYATVTAIRFLCSAPMFTAGGQYNQSVGYRTPLETRVAKKTTKAITDFNLVEDGDRIMVGLSGGKDSWALIQILDVLQKRAPIDFSIVAVNVDSGYEGYQHTQVADACKARGWEFHSEHTNIGAVIDDKLESDDTPCSLCARLRRGVLYRLAKQTGATKIALGHHLDDFVERVLLNLFFAGALKAM